MSWLPCPGCRDGGLHVCPRQLIRRPEFVLLVALIAVPSGAVGALTVIFLARVIGIHVGF